MSKSKIIILLGFGAILLLVTLLITIGVGYLNKSKGHLDDVVNTNNLKIELLTNMHQSARERTIHLQQMLITLDETSFQNHRKKMAFFGGEFVLSRNKLLTMDLSSKEKKLFDKQAVLSRDVGPVQNKIADLVDFNAYSEAQQLLVNSAEPLQNKVFAVLSQLQELQREQTQNAFKTNSANYKKIVVIMLGVTFIVIVLSISIIFFILKLISKNEKQKERYRQDIEQQAFFDHLTGLPNRRLFNDRMSHAISYTERDETLMAVLFIDCDRFKPINDSLGHIVGDALLISIANRLKQSVRSSDTVCRVSGDEFAIVLEQIKHISAIDRIAQNILGAVAAPHHIEGHKVFTTVSIGITVYPIDEKNIEGLLSSADIAMYHAKQSGGNRYEYFDSKMNSRYKLRLSLEQDLHDALINDELEIYYQPLNSIETNNKIIAAEALLRWHHPQNGMISPVDFIRIAEDSGLIVSIGEWVLLTACSQIKKWEEQGYGKITVCVNLSPRQFTDANLIPAVKDALDVSGIDPSQLDLEITESTSMAVIQESIDILHKLKKLGVNISIDDFGTGYSSLSYLQQMPIDNLKIDRSFVENLHHSSKDKAFVQAIVTMAHTLGIKTIAEGVEISEQLDFLEGVRCEIAQGYLFSKPVPAKQFEHLFKKK